MATKGIAEPARRLTAIELAGFKSAIDPVRVNFRDITVLAGANSTGKSTIMQPLLLIKQTIEKPFDPGGLAIDGPLVRFTDFDQFLAYRLPRNTQDAFHVTFWHEGSPIALRYGRSALFGAAVSEMRFRNDDQELSWLSEQTFDLDALEKVPQLALRLRIILEVLKRQEPSLPLVVRAELGVLVLGIIDDEDRSIRRFDRNRSPPPLTAAVRAGQAGAVAPCGLS